MANVTRKDGRLQDDKGNWVWGGESYEEVLKHPDWLPLVFQNNESAEKFKKLEKIWKAEQIVKTSKNKQEVAAAKGWLKNNIQHSDGNFIYIPQNDFDFLMHHGIRGQKWGVENGPPYPLSPSKDYTAAEKKANKILNKVSKKYDNSKVQNTVYETIKDNFNKEGKVVYGSASAIGSKKLTDDATYKSIEKSKKQLQKLIDKYGNDKDILKNINTVEKQIDSIAKSMDNIKLGDELGKVAKQYAGAVNAAGLYSGMLIGPLGAMIGTLASEGATTADLNKRLKTGELHL